MKAFSCEMSQFLILLNNLKKTKYELETFKAPPPFAQPTSNYYMFDLILLINKNQQQINVVAFLQPFNENISGSLPGDVRFMGQSKQTSWD